MNEDGEWKHYPYLKQISFEILRLHEQGLTQSEIREMSKNKEIKDEQGIAVPSSTVDRLYRDLVQLQLIKKNRKTLNVTTGIPCNQIVDLAFVKNLKKTRKH